MIIQSYETINDFWIGQLHKYSLTIQPGMAMVAFTHMTDRNKDGAAKLAKMLDELDVPANRRHRHHQDLSLVAVVPTSVAAIIKLQWTQP